MSMGLWRVPVFLLGVGLAGFAPNAWPQSAPAVPDDSTADVEEQRQAIARARSLAAAEVEAEERAGREGAEKDDPTYRLDWQRKAWGVTTASFRDLALKSGRDHSSRKHARGPRWVNIGPTGADYEQNGSFTGKVRDSGRARTILTHPWDADVVYFLTSGGGLWRTDNWTAEHTRWKTLTDDLPTTGGGAVAFGRHPRTLYLGLGDPYDQILVGGAMVKSRNRGEDWSEPIELGSAVSVRDVKVDTSQPQDIVLVATDSGLYRSSDAGQSYIPAAAFAGRSVWSIERTSAGWLASAQPCPTAAVGLRCGQPTTLFLSTDLGASWAPITNAGGVFASNGRTTLGVARPGASAVYAYSSDLTDAQMKDVYRSGDGGQSWVANGVNATKIPTNPIPGSMPNMNICHGQCWYNQMVLVDPRDASGNTVWIGGDLGSARSTDGGATWTIATWWLYSQVPSIPYAHADFHAAAFKETGTPTLILGNDGGLNISVDDGASFSSDKNNGLVTHLFYTVAGSPDFPNLVIGGTQDDGTRLRTGNGTIYNQVLGGDGMGTGYSQQNTNTVIASAQGSNMRTNLSNTPPEVIQNFVGATSGLADVGFGFFTAVVPAPAGLDPTGRVFFHFSNARVWRSNNGGLNWNLIGSAVGVPSPGLPPVRRFRSSPYNLGVSPSDLNRIAVGAAGGFLDITTDGGATWTDLNLSTLVPGYQGFVTNVTWQDNQNLWITAVAQAAGAVRVIKASIASPAASWASASFTPMQSGLPDLPVTRVYFDPRDASRATIFAATHVGIYRTLDGGASWEPYGSGLPTVRVNDIYMPSDGGFMRIATYGRGIWELPQIEFVRALLTDDRRSCDWDGVLDDGERGSLTIALKNQGRSDVFVKATVSSSNPHVSFPRGNVAYFGVIDGRRVGTDSIRVALDGASGVETTDFQIAIEAPQLGLPEPLHGVSTHALNFDDRRRASSRESVESERHGWTSAGDPVGAPNVAAWERRELSPLRHVFWGPDNNGQTDGERPDLPDEQSLVSPRLRVGAGPLVVAFQHRFAFEGGDWDGGVIEISTDDGATWLDVGAGAYNGSTNGVTTAPIGASRPAFVGRSTGWPGFTPVALDLGTAFANQDLKLRFRIGADESTGAPGWDIDDIDIGGLTRNPFRAHVAETAACRVGRHH